MRVPLCVIVVALLAAGCCGELSAQTVSSGCGTSTVALVVEPVLRASIRAALRQFEADLCTAGYNTVARSSGLTDPSEVRRYLKRLYAEPGRNLVGAILIGDIPRAYQWIPDTSQEAMSFQYYADLNGRFARSRRYVSPGGHTWSFDIHDGDVDWEIWVGVLPPYKGDPAQTAAAINRYFAKNHAFRTRRLTRPKVFLQISEHFHATTLADHDFYVGAMQTGTYAWTPFSAAASARLYFDSPPGGLSIDQGYSDLRDGVADFTVADAHGYWGASGELTIEAVESNPVQTLHFWGNGCAIGDLDHADNFLTSVLYSPTSDVVFAKGTTNDSGGLGSNLNGFFGHNLATSLAAKHTWGTALLEHINVPLLAPWSESRELHFGTLVVLGDPTLRRTADWWEQDSYALDCTTRPTGTVCVSYDDGFVWLVKDTILRWERRGRVQTAVGAAARYEHRIGTPSVRVSHNLPSR